MSAFYHEEFHVMKYLKRLWIELSNSGSKMGDNIKMYLRDVRYENGYWIRVA
jgi:hypothetical protein